MDRAENQLLTITSWSFVRLVEDYEVCPYKAYLLHVEKRPRPQRTGEAGKKADEALKRGKIVHTGAEDFIQCVSDNVVPELERVTEKLHEYRDLFQQGKVQVEQNWGFDRDWAPTGWFDPNCWLRVKQDVFVNFGTEGITDDWKTGKKFGNEVKHAQQGQLYALSAFMRYPELEKIKVRFTYVDHPRSTDTEREYTRAQLMRLLPTWNSRALKMTTATEFPAKPSKLACRFCPFGPSNGDGSCEAGVEV